MNGRRASLIAPFAGLIRYPELSNGFIPHALAATIGADMLACQPTSPEAYNFTGQAFPQAWPAFGYDQQNIAGGALGAASGGLYKNAYGNIPMGSLLAIPKSLTLSPSLFQTCTGPNDTICQVYVVAVALQDYGAYVVDTGSNTYMTLMAELNDADVVRQNPTYLANDLAHILHNLELVTNNSQTTVGGVATSIITNLAPPFTY